MAHVHGEKTVASQMKSAVNAGAAKMMDSPMGKMGIGAVVNERMSPMMHEGSAPVMKVGEGMVKVMKTPKTPIVVGSGVASAAAAGTGKTVMGKFFKHPLVLFSLGVVAG